MKNFTTILFLSGFLFAAVAVKSQITDPVNTVTNKASDRTNNKIDNGIDKGLNGLEGVFKKKDKTKNKKATDSANVQGTTTTEGPKAKDDPFTSYSKYDFIPGENVIFYDDFSQATIGDFPASWNTDISGEVVTTNSYTGKWFKLGSNGSFVPEIKDAFPDNYTVEFDLIPGADSKFGFYIYEAQKPSDLNEGGAVPGVQGIKMWFGNYSHSYDTYNDGGYALNGSSEKALLQAGKSARFSFWIQKQRIRAYINEEKVFDVAKAFPPGMKANAIRFLSGSEGEPLINNVRFAVGAPDMRSKLITEGKLVSYGCYFDSGSDKLKPESYGTLKEIAAVLNENPTVKIKIVGHTDSDGSDALNLDLSKKRAAAVKTALNTEFAIDNSRMDTDGKGMTEPVAPNTTSEGKAKNRRVEFIKL